MLLSLLLGQEPLFLLHGQYIQGSVVLFWDSTARSFGRNSCESLEGSLYFQSLSFYRTFDLEKRAWSQWRFGCRHNVIIA